MLRSMGPSWAAPPTDPVVAVVVAPVSAPIEQMDTGESDCILAAKLKGLLAVGVGVGVGVAVGVAVGVGVGVDVGEAELDGSCCGGVARMATGVWIICGLWL